MLMEWNNKGDFSLCVYLMLGDPSGSPLGCTNLVKDGAVPNEYGTWLYGRGGWCDGLQVDPWRIDITAQVSDPTILAYSTWRVS